MAGATQAAEELEASDALRRYKGGNALANGYPRCSIRERLEYAFGLGGEKW
jgi:hypothetical protein